MFFSAMSDSFDHLAERLEFSKSPKMFIISNINHIEIGNLHIVNNISSTAADNLLVGGGLDDIFDMNGIGANTVYGHRGRNTANYNNATVPFVAYIGFESTGGDDLIRVFNGSYENSDRLFAISSVIGSDHDDLFIFMNGYDPIEFLEIDGYEGENTFEVALDAQGLVVDAVAGRLMIDD